MALRSGFVSIIGRPNAGKSTLLNALVGQKVAIVTHKPQTTRNRIQGIVNVPARKGRPAGQVVFLDTPGVHKPQSSLNKKMMREVHDALEGRDLLLLITDVTEKFGGGDEFVLDLVKRAGGPAFLLLNKIDRVDKSQLLPLIEGYNRKHAFQEIIPISALKRDGLNLLLDKVIHALPEGPRYFPKNQVTDQPERFLAAEIIREKILIATGQEVPYASTVQVENWEESPKLTKIAAVLYCERDGQKKILIGKGGEMMKRIGTSARLEIEKLLGTKVFLEMFVKVEPNWRESREFVEGLDWRHET
jgi:GTP-binding protein Era